MANYNQTYSRRRVNPLDPDPQDIELIDIAHHLAINPRYTGATYAPYSVAQHSVLCSEYVGRDVGLQRWALLHDAAEAYMSDLPLFVKNDLDRYKELEDQFLVAIARRFGFFGNEIPPEVRDVDQRLVLVESEDLFLGGPRSDCFHIMPAVVAQGRLFKKRLIPMPWDEAKHAFLQRAIELRVQQR